MEHFLTITDQRSTISVWSGRSQLFPFSLLISDPLFTSSFLYTLISLLLQRILNKLQVSVDQSALLAMISTFTFALTSSAIAECQKDPIRVCLITTKTISTQSQNCIVSLRIKIWDTIEDSDHGPALLPCAFRGTILVIQYYYNQIHSNLHQARIIIKLRYLPESEFCSHLHSSCTGFRDGLCSLTVVEIFSEKNNIKLLSKHVCIWTRIKEGNYWTLD